MSSSSSSSPPPLAAPREQKHKPRLPKRSSVRAALFSLQPIQAAGEKTPRPSGPAERGVLARGALPAPGPPPGSAARPGHPGAPGGRAPLPSGPGAPQPAGGQPAVLASLATPTGAGGVDDSVSQKPPNRTQRQPSAEEREMPRPLTLLRGRPGHRRGLGEGFPGAGRGCSGFPGHRAAAKATARGLFWSLLPGEGFALHSRLHITAPPGTERTGGGKTTAKASPSYPRR